MPYHRLLDSCSESALASGKKIGTTGRGIGPCYGDKILRKGIKAGDLLDAGSLMEKLRENLEEKNFLFSKKFNCEPLKAEAIYDEYMQYAERLAPYIDNVSVALDEGRKAGKHILFEGAQGTQLDIDHGTYPFVTSSNTVAGNACTGSGFGPFPTELLDGVGDELQQKGGEVGATTGRKRRCGWLDGVIAREAVRLNGINGLAITKLDVLSGQPTLKLATSYEADGKKMTALPGNIKTLAKLKPIYEDLAGWSEEISQARSVDDLPAKARDYVKRIEEFTETPAYILSVGPGREQTMLLNNPFQK